MKNEIQSCEPEGEPQLVSLGGQNVSMQLVQSIYNEITGKKETIARRYHDNHQTVFSDLKTLNTKIEQLYEQYKIVSKNCSVSIYYLNDCREIYSSFERFELYDSTSISPVENVLLEYNFLIILPNTQKPQSYKIEINLTSRVALMKRQRLETGLERKLFSIMGRMRTAGIEIEYIDYTVARNFMVAIEEWFKSIHKIELSKFLNFSERHSEYIPIIYQIITVAILTTALFSNHESLLGSNPSVITLFGAAILSMGSFYFVLIVVRKLGRISESAFDFYKPASGLKLNRGDEIAFKEYETSNRKQLVGLLVATLLTIGINIISAYLASTLGL